LKTLTFIGGSGFVGKSYIDAFNRGILKKFNIKKLNIICRNPNKIKIITQLRSKNVKIFKGDIGKIKKLPQSDIIIFSAESSNTRNYKNSKNVIEKHKKSIINFCELTRKNKKCKVLYISSGAVYRNKINNSDLAKYKNLYSYLKIFSEKKIRELIKFNIKTSIARCFSFVGPYLLQYEHYAIGNFINDGKNKKNITVKAKHQVIRSYMYSDDLVVWLTKIAINSKISCPTYNVGSTYPVELGKLAKIIGKIFNKPVVMKRKNNKVDRYIPNIRKAKKELNLKIKYSLKEAIYSSIRNYDKIFK
jgi:nucleoside-diphosphate-sugar epimerase